MKCDRGGGLCRYSHRARNIRNKPTKNVDQNMLQVINLRKTVLVRETADVALPHTAVTLNSLFAL